MAASPSHTYVNDGDAALVSRVLAGEKEAYGILMDRYRDRFCRYATHLLGDRSEAEDALQETFVRGYRFLAQCQDRDRFGAWLFRILVNRCRTAHGSRRRSGAALRLEDEPHLAVRGEPADQVAWRDEIQRALSRLPTDHREAFLLKYVEELSYEEMETITGVGISALKMRTKRACDRLRQLLGEVYDARS
jgi:RNA polymerase sigma-70 factor (ECF subfamily)